MSAAEAEQAFLAQVEIARVKYPGTDLPIGDTQALKVGHAACDALRNPDLTLDDVGYTLQDAGSYSARDAGKLVGAAVGALCPELRDRLATQR